MVDMVSCLLNVMQKVGIGLFLNWKLTIEVHMQTKAKRKCKALKELKTQENGFSEVISEQIDGEQDQCPALVIHWPD